MYRYKDLLRRVPQDVDVEFEYRDGKVILRMSKFPRASNPLKAIPTLF